MRLLEMRFAPVRHLELAFDAILVTRFPKSRSNF